MEMVLQRNYHLVTTKGHSMYFKKGEPTWVHPLIVAEAIAVGAVAVDEDQPDPLPADDTGVACGPQEHGARTAELFAAFAKLEGANIREDWTAGGVPTTYALARVLGWAPDAKERNTSWQGYCDEKAKAGS